MRRSIFLSPLIILCYGVPLARMNAVEAPVNAPETPAVVRDTPGWPLVFELSYGDEFEIERTFGGKTVKRKLRLVSAEESWEADFWCEKNPDKRTLRDVKVAIEVDGKPRTLLARPFQMPTATDGLRIYVESTRTWAHHGNIAKLRWYGGDVRFSIVAEGESWGPEDFRYPVGNFRWHANTYNNIWLQLVPYNLLYYHHGHDAGAVPDILPVISMMDGVAAVSPLPEDKGGSNVLCIDHPSGLRALYAHMNKETIDPRLTVGAEVKAGDVLAKTGMTWDGYKSQKGDHHLHAGLLFEGTEISTYPFMAEAYMRDYDDEVLAVAGGYAYGLPGDTVHLDGSRSIVRDGQRITNCRWRLHDGREVEGFEADVTYDKPGQYSEALIIRTDKGAEDHDYLQVRIYNADHGRDIARGWIYHTPVRGIVPGTVVTFENRVRNDGNGAFFDFGDGTELQPVGEYLDVEHVYKKPGIYDVSLSAEDVHGERTTIQMRVVVESAAP